MDEPKIYQTTLYIYLIKEIKIFQSEKNTNAHNYILSIAVVYSGESDTGICDVTVSLYIHTSGKAKNMPEHGQN